MSVAPFAKWPRYRIPSARNSSSNDESLPWSPDGTSEIRKHVAWRDFRNPKKWKSSRRGLFRRLRLYRAARLSIATRSNAFTRTRWSMYFWRTSNEPDGAIKGWWGDYQRWKQPARWDAPFSIEGPPSRGFRSLKPGKSESGCSASFGAGLPICSARTYAGRDGPRGDPAGLVVLPPRVRREPDGRRVRRRDADGLRPNLPGRRAALRRWEDLARPRGWHRVRGVPGFAPDRANQPLRTEFHVVVRIVRGGTRGLRGPRHRRAPGGPNRGVPQTADAQAPRCKSPRPRPVRFRRRRPDAQPRDSRVVDPAFFLRRRAARAPCHHPYHARPASGGECHRIPDRPEARALVSSTGRASSPR